MKPNHIAWVALAMLLLLSSCASKKGVVGSQQPKKQQTTSSETTVSPEVQILSFVQKVADRQVYAQNIVGSMTVSLTAGNKNITAPGAIRMRKDKVIRIQAFIPLLGSEVGRIEFTPDYVLVVDRIHREYIKTDYQQLDFLKNNGLNFYTLQALFWSQLLLPGKQKVMESDLKLFSANLNHAETIVPVSLQRPPISYQWNAEKASGQIQSAQVKYASNQHGVSNVTWNYDKFVPVGVKMFPSKQTISFTTTATKAMQSGKITFDMDEVTTDSNWDEYTTVSDRYKKMDGKDILGKLLNR